jgi:hypothetical protein
MPICEDPVPLAPGDKPDVNIDVGAVTFNSNRIPIYAILCDDNGNQFIRTWPADPLTAAPGAPVSTLVPLGPVLVPVGALGPCPDIDWEQDLSMCVTNTVTLVSRPALILRGWDRTVIPSSLVDQAIFTYTSAGALVSYVAGVNEVIERCSAETSSSCCRSITQEDGWCRYDPATETYVYDVSIIYLWDMAGAAPVLVDAQYVLADGSVITFTGAQVLRRCSLVLGQQIYGNLRATGPSGLLRDSDILAPFPGAYVHSFSVSVVRDDRANLSNTAPNRVEVNGPAAALVAAGVPGPNTAVVGNRLYGAMSMDTPWAMDGELTIRVFGSAIAQFTALIKYP